MTLDIDVDSNIGIVSIGNNKKNEINSSIFLDIKELEEKIDHYKLKGLIITGKGKHFSIGANLDYLYANRHNSQFHQELVEGHKILKYLELLPIITVAAIDGCCFGAGLEIALCCQFRFATERALFAFPESNIGIMPGFLGTQNLSKIIGRSKTIEMILSGNSLNAEKAFQIGLINGITIKENHIDYSKNFIRSLIQDKDSSQIRLILQSINYNIDSQHNSDVERKSFLELLSQID